MRVPDEAGSGSAKVTVSFPGWKEGKVVPATYQLSIVPDTNEPAFPMKIEKIKSDLEAEIARLGAKLSTETKAGQTDDERSAGQQWLVRESEKVTVAALERVLAILRPHAADPAAIEPFLWVIRTSPVAGFGDEAADLLAKHHLTHEKTIALASMSWTFPRKWAEPMLRAQLAAANVPPPDRARLLYALAAMKKTMSEMPHALAEMSEDRLSQLEKFLGKEMLADLRKLDVAKTEAQAIILFTELAEKYGTEKLGSARTYGTIANSAVFEIRHLSVGKVVPDIVGEDVDGTKFKLSDYRGKVVLLVFWGTWCRPCMAQVPHEREIVERLNDRPFALIGVNSDADRKKLKRDIDAAKITWRSFWCGEDGATGDIPTTWNVRSWPTTYVIDYQGVIRAKNVSGGELDRLLDGLLGGIDAKK